MATIKVTRVHTLNKAEARKRAENLAKDIAAKYQFDWEWAGDVIEFEANKGPASGTTGNIKIGASDIVVFIDLPFLLGFGKAKIEAEVVKKLEKAVA